MGQKSGRPAETLVVGAMAGPSQEACQGYANETPTRVRRQKRVRTPTPTNSNPISNYINNEETNKPLATKLEFDNYYVPTPSNCNTNNKAVSHVFTQPQQQQQRPGTQASQVTGNKWQQPRQRPASAMAGQLRSGNSQQGNNENNNNPATSSSTSSSVNKQTDKLKPTTNIKTTRVRINSTSEQIQDPNWLIEMSKGQDAGSSKRGFYLKSLQQRLKSTISGTSASTSSGPNIKVPATSTQQQQPTTGDQSGDSRVGADCSTVMPLPPPSTPIKVPVSILKQPNSAGRHLSASNPSTPTPTSRLDDKPRKRMNNQSTVASPRKERRKVTANTAASRQVSKSDNQTAASTSKAPRKSTKNQQQDQDFKGERCLSADQEVGQKGITQSQQQPSSPSQATSCNTNRPVPICADGQVKVSGWKRNNLLAKTLSHFDEIRGNQRPIFMPTKIMLAPGGGSGGSGSANSESLPLHSPQSPTQPGQHANSPSISLTQALPSNRGSSGNSKFAELVREAISKKSLLSGPLSGVNSTGANGASNTNQQQQSSFGNQEADKLEKRGSDAGERHLVSTTLGRQRPGSADPSNRSSISSASGFQAPASAPNSLQTRKPVSPKGSIGGGQPSMAQIIAAAVAATQGEHHHLQRSSFSSPSTALASPSSSSRVFKLQLKNEQVLQNLRRQSNEMAREALHLQAVSDQQQLDASSPGQSQSGSVHLKDWKRLTSKLGLLKHRTGNAGVVRSTACTPPNGQATNNEAGSSGSNLMALRLTVSNQESASSARNQRKRSSGAGSTLEQACTSSAQHLAAKNLRVPGGALDFMTLQLLANDQQQRRPSNQSNLSYAGASNQEERRKLSSSSMVVQTVSSAPTATATGFLRATAKLVMSGRRRPSRSAATSPMLHAQESPVNLRRSSDSEACCGMTGASPAGGCSSNSMTGAKSGLIEHDGHGSCTPNEKPLTGSQTSLSAQPKAIPIVVHRDDLIKLLQVNGDSECDAQSDGQQTEKLAGTAIEETEPTKTTIEQTVTKLDLSRVVKRTSKVAYFQQKLRKIHWNSKQKQLKAEAEAVAAATAAATAAQELNQQTDNLEGETTLACKKEADITMDPTLIGDAIESLLRASMQQQQDGDHEDGDRTGETHEADTSARKVGNDSANNHTSQLPKDEVQPI